MSYGCHDHAEFVQGHTIHGVSKTTGERVWVSVPFRNARDCQYTLSELGRSDKRCAGCKWRAEHGA